MNLVIGSGPAGVAAAHALLERGQRVTLLDTGIEMDDRAAAIKREAGTASDLTEVRQQLGRLEQPVGGALPMKTVFGSDFPYRDVAGCATLRGDETVDLLMSYARGGLSNLWGANVLPFSHQELASWPVPHAAMQAAYRAVMPLITLSASRDDGLVAHLPLHTEKLDPRYLRRQASAMLRDLTRRRTELADAGVIFGASRIGVATKRRCSLLWAVPGWLPKRPDLQQRGNADTAATKSPATLCARRLRAALPGVSGLRRGDR